MYGEKVMLHNLVYQTMADNKAYGKLSNDADTRLWLFVRQRFQEVMAELLERYAYEYDVIVNIAVRERNELRKKTDVEDDVIRLYNIQADLLDEVATIKHRMIRTLKTTMRSMALVKRYTKTGIGALVELTDLFVQKLRDLSDVARLMEKYDVPFDKNF